jgi:transcriptional regulator with XRE-family HTH domain
VSDPAARALGRKIAFHRTQRGLSQRDFGAIIDRSETWVSQVERGVRRIDRMTILRRVAEALDVPLNELAADTPIVAAVNQGNEPADRLRLMLVSSLALAAVVRPVRRVDLAKLTRDTDRAWELAHRADFTEVVPLLVELVPRLETACRSPTKTGEDVRFALLARSYHATAAVLAKLGHTDPACVAADRAIAAAERAGDPLLMAAGAFRLTLALQAGRRYDQVEQAARTAVEAIAPLVATGDAGALSVAGALRLQLAVAAARVNDVERAYQQLGFARALADRLGNDGDEYDTEFGPTNVALHEVAVAVEIGDAGTALRLATNIDAGALSPERQARLLIDVARAHLQRRNPSGVIRALLDAERITPEHVHTHRLVKNILYDLVRSEQRSDPQVRGLARRCGVYIR